MADSESDDPNAFTNETYKSKYQTANQNQRIIINEQYNEEFDQQMQQYDQQPEQQDQQPVYVTTVQPNNNYENTYYFSKKIHNSGFWGDVKRRRGTWLVGIGAVFICISIVMIAVFWRWWYGPEVNVPCRIVAITLLICGVACLITGLISNAFMNINKESKYFLGAPPRWSSYLLLCGVLFIIIGADFITFYYSYWHNRFINTPFIISGIIVSFFGVVFVGIGIDRNLKEMKKQQQLAGRNFK